MLLGRCWSPTRRGQLTGGRSCWPPPPPPPGSRPSSSPATSPHLTTSRSALTAVLWIRITLMWIRIPNFYPDPDPDPDLSFKKGSNPWNSATIGSYSIHFCLTSANWWGSGSGFLFDADADPNPDPGYRILPHFGEGFLGLFWAVFLSPTLIFWRHTVSQNRQFMCFRLITSWFCLCWST